ncbi:hypothetical protein D3C75_791240 [compost metagenome]
MGNIMQQVLLGLHQGLELAGHAVTVLGQVDDFVTALAQPRPDPHIETALGNLAHGLAQPGQRPGQVKAAQQREQRAHHRPCHKRAKVAWARCHTDTGGHRSAQHQRAAVTVEQCLLETRHVHRLASQQAALIVVKAYLHILRLWRHVQQLAAGPLAMPFEHLQLGGQQRTEPGCIAAQLIEHEGPRPHQEGQGVGQPERQEQLPEQTPAHHSTISM